MAKSNFDHIPRGKEIPIEDQIRFFQSVGNWPPEWSCLSEDQCQIINEWCKKREAVQQKENETEEKRIIGSAYLGLIPLALWDTLPRRYDGIAKLLMAFAGSYIGMALVFWVAFEFYRNFGDAEGRPLGKAEIAWKTVIVITVAAFVGAALIH